MCIRDRYTLVKRAAEDREVWAAINTRRCHRPTTQQIIERRRCQYKTPAKIKQQKTKQSKSLKYLRQAPSTVARQYDKLHISTSQIMHLYQAMIRLHTTEANKINRLNSRHHALSKSQLQ